MKVKAIVSGVILGINFFLLQETTEIYFENVKWGQLAASSGSVFLLLLPSFLLPRVGNGGEMTSDASD